MTHQATNIAATPDRAEGATPPAPRRHRGRKALAAGLIGGLALFGFGATSADAATGTTGQHYLSAATCKPISSPVVAGQDVITVKAPTIYAANVTAGSDSQLVGFRQRLVKWSGTAWVNAGQSTAVWTSPATDSRAAATFTDNAGRTVSMPAFNFTAGAGYYAVVTDYFWYGTRAGSNTTWAHHSNNNPTSYCRFVY